MVSCLTADRCAGSGEYDMDVTDFGAAGDGAADDTDALQRAFDSRMPGVPIRIPAGDYRVTSTLHVLSNTKIEADCAARIFLCGETPKKRGDFLLTNSDHDSGNCDITIFGGIWDGNNRGRCNKLDCDASDADASPGCTAYFSGVQRLSLRSMVFANSADCSIRMYKVSDFKISDILFFSKKKICNQDGIHFGGYVQNGTIENIRAIGGGQTNDDFLAFYTGDLPEYPENSDLRSGPVSGITVDGVRAVNCGAAVYIRGSQAHGIKLRNIEAGVCRGAVRIDSANRDAPRRSEIPAAFGNDIEIENLTAWFVCKTSEPLISIGADPGRISIRGLVRAGGKDQSPDAPLLRIDDVCGTEAFADGRPILAAQAETANISDGVFEFHDDASELLILNRGRLT